MKTVPKPEVQPKNWKFTALIILAGFLLYAHTLRFGFNYLDDNFLILDHQYFLRNAGNILEAFRHDVFFSPHGTGAYYRPMMTLSLMLDARFGGTAPFVYRLTNLLLHLLASVLVFRLLIKMKYPDIPAFYFSLFFALHPVLTQAVCWIPGRNDSLLAVFSLAACISALSFWETTKLRHAFSHALFFALAMFTKESSAALVPLCLLYRRLVEKKPVFPGGSFLAAGWLLAAGAWFLLRSLAIPHPIPVTVLNVIKSVFINLPAAVSGIGHILLPFDLFVLAVRSDMRMAGGLAVIAALVLALVLSKQKRPDRIAFGSAWFLFFLLPAFISPDPAVPSNFIAHRIYLPFFGVILVFLEIDWIKNFKKTGTAVFGAVVLAVFSAVTFAHSLNFRDSLSFWHSAAVSSPHSALAHRNFGAMLYLTGRLDEAEPEFKRALNINALEPMAHNNLGLIYASKKMFPEAEEEYRKELMINPNYDGAHFNLGLLYHRMGKIGEAENCWLKTIDINPDYADAYVNLAISHYQRGEIQEAAVYIRRLRAKGIPVQPAILKALNL